MEGPRLGLCTPGVWNSRQLRRGPGGGAWGRWRALCGGDLPALRAPVGGDLGSTQVRHRAGI